jgi:hypothetical protein
VQGPLVRSRLVLGVGVLLLAATGSVVVAPGASSAPVAMTARTVGPVAVAPARPLSAALLGPVRLPSLSPRGVLVGPRAVPVVGPPTLIGPTSSPSQVRVVQRLLNARGAALRVDGAWGPATTAAVEAAQAAAGLPTSGRADPLTLAVLRG